MDLTQIDQRRKARHLAAEVSAAVEKAGARFVLITSVSRGDGKTRLAATLKKELASIALDRFVVLTWKQLGTFHPSEFADSTVVIVDGPAMLQGEEILQVPPDWMDAFDAALLVVMKRHTQRAELEEAVSWLKAAGIPPIGVVWNEHRFPPLQTVIARLRARKPTAEAAEESPFRPRAIERRPAVAPSPAEEP